MDTTVGVRSATRDRLARLKRELGVVSIDEALQHLLDEREELERRRTSDAFLAALAKHRTEVADLCARHHIHRLSAFGSALHGDAGPDSDIDLLVEFDGSATVSYFDMSRTEEALSDLLGHHVDLRTAEELSRYFRDDVLAEAQVIHVAA